MNDIITKFHAYLLTEKRVSANTFAAYKQDIEQLISYLQKQKLDLNSWASSDIKKYMYHLKEELGLSARSMARKISALKVLCLYMHDYLQMPNLAEDLTWPKIEKKLPNYLSEDEIKQLLVTAEKDSTYLGKRNKVLLYLLYVSGMRISELIQLQLSHIHFDTGFIAVAGKGGKSRMVPIPQSMAALLREYIDTVHAHFTHNNRSTDYLFPIYYAGTIKPITRQAAWGILKNICKKGGIMRAISPHQLRHSLATHMLKNGADLRSLQLLLGHESIATVQIYTHVETSHLRAIYDKKHPRS